MAKFNKKIKDTSVRLGEVRFSDTAVFQPKKNDDGTPSKYGVCIIIPKEDTETVNLVKEAIDAAKQRGKHEKWGGKIPANVKSCLRDGDIDREDDEAFAGCYFLNASSRNKPGVKVLEDGFVEFFEKSVPANPLKAEYLLPIYIGELLEKNAVTVQVLPTHDKWFGVTYKEDKQTVIDSFAKLVADGVYQKNLFSDLKH